MKNSKIEWTDHTFNPWIGCTKVSPGCAHCYAEAMDHRFGHDSFGPGRPRRRTSEANWKQPLKWDRSASDGPIPGDDPLRRPRVFCASLADVFDPEVPRTWRGDLLNLIRLTPNLDWLLLTKRPELVMSQLEDCLELLRDSCVEIPDSDDWSKTCDWLGVWVNYSRAPSNVWIGTTVENQEMADKRIPELLKIPAKVRFLSCEPMLDFVDIEEYLDDQCDGGYVLGSAPIHWVICGGESGPKARPMHPDWAWSLRDQCAAAGVPFLFKQWGEWSPGVLDSKGEWHVFADGSRVKRRGKHAAGRLLDGVQHDGYPTGGQS